MKAPPFSFMIIDGIEEINQNNRKIHGSILCRSLQKKEGSQGGTWIRPTKIIPPKDIAWWHSRMKLRKTIAIFILRYSSRY